MEIEIMAEEISFTEEEITKIKSLNGVLGTVSSENFAMAFDMISKIQKKGEIDDDIREKLLRLLSQMQAIGETDFERVKDAVQILKDKFGFTY
jgi:hypothetical protein